MKANLECPEPIEVDFDTEFSDEDFDDQPTIVKLTSTPTPAAQSKRADDGLLDLSDESTLDKLSSGGFLRIFPEGQNVISVALLKPAVQAKTHYSPTQKKVFSCLQPASDFCCTKLGEARDVIGVLAIQYAAASTKDGSLKKGTDPDLHLGYVTLSKSALVSMRKSLDEGATLYSTDWKIWKRSSGIGYEYSPQRPEPLYKTLNLEKQVELLIAPYKDGVKLRTRVAKPMSLVEVRTLLTGEMELDEGKQLDDMETM
jgi:hypothetical protein